MEPKTTSWQIASTLLGVLVLSSCGMGKSQDSVSDSARSNSTKLKSSGAESGSGTSGAPSQSPSTYSAQTVMTVAAPTCQLISSVSSGLIGQVILLTLRVSGQVDSARIGLIPVPVTGGTISYSPTRSETITATVVGPGGAGSCSTDYSAHKPAVSFRPLSFEDAGVGLAAAGKGAVTGKVGQTFVFCGGAGFNDGAVIQMAAASVPITRAASIRFQEYGCRKTINYHCPANHIIVNDSATRTVGCAPLLPGLQLTGLHTVSLPASRNGCPLNEIVSSYTHTTLSDTYTLTCAKVSWIE